MFPYGSRRIVDRNLMVTRRYPIVAANWVYSRPSERFCGGGFDFDNDGILEHLCQRLQHVDRRCPRAPFSIYASRAELGVLLKVLSEGRSRMLLRDELDGCGRSHGGNFGDLDNDGYLDFISERVIGIRSLMPKRDVFTSRVANDVADVTFSGGFWAFAKRDAIRLCRTFPLERRKRCVY